MSTWVLGDIQGCFSDLLGLLDDVGYTPERDELWFVGDLINRGHNNLDTMRFIMEQPRVTSVLGNHDLHFLAVARGHKAATKKDTFGDLLDSRELYAVIEWLLSKPLVVYEREHLLVHAGIPHIWDLEQCLACAREVETVLQSADAGDFFDAMYGDEPALWEPNLTGTDRLRTTTNYLTRMRFCSDEGRLDLKHKTLAAPDGYAPWFSWPREQQLPKILFGHWAALGGKTGNDACVALDTGCVWGNSLTLMRLEDGKIHSRRSSLASKV